jgi:hypothetical protein
VEYISPYIFGAEEQKHSTPQDNPDKERSLFPFDAQKRLCIFLTIVNHGSSRQDGAKLELYYRGLSTSN